MLNFEEVFNHFGSQNKLAGILDVSTQAVSHWKKNGSFPAKQAVEIERLTEGKFKAVDLVTNKGE